jgi:uncharacterized protein YkwD
MNRLTNHGNLPPRPSVVVPVVPLMSLTLPLWLGLLGALLPFHRLNASQGLDLPSLRKMALSLTNRNRLRHGRSALRLDVQLNQAAQRHAEDMLKRNYFSHKSPEGHSPSDRFARVGGRGGAGENLAWFWNPTKTDVDAERLTHFDRQWMGSPKHRDNLLDRRYTRFGFGVTIARARVYAVQLFSIDP